MQKYTQWEIIQIIKDSGLKYTEHRFNILSKITKSKTSMSSIKLIEDMKKKYHIDQATVYRNLKSLEEFEIIKKSDYGDGVFRYELCTEDDGHKVICSKCYFVEKISGLSADEVLKKIVKKSKKFKTANIINFEIYGLCKSCT